MPRFCGWIIPIVLMGGLGACSSFSAGNPPFETLPPLASQPIAPSAIADVQAADVATKPFAVASVSVAAVQRKTPRGKTAHGRARDWRVLDVRVHVPPSLRVSEANRYVPTADIVWREDPFGDRRAQVRDIIDLAASQAVLGLEGSHEVYIDIDLKRFHALSRKARATVGGWHNIRFDVTVRDGATNAPLAPHHEVAIRLKAYGGQRAIRAEMRGETQKVRIMREVASVLRTFLRG